MLSFIGIRTRVVPAIHLLQGSVVSFLHKEGTKPELVLFRVGKTHF